MENTVTSNHDPSHHLLACADSLSTRLRMSEHHWCLPGPGPWLYILESEGNLASNSSKTSSWISVSHRVKSTSWLGTAPAAKRAHWQHCGRAGQAAAVTGMGNNLCLITARAILLVLPARMSGAAAGNCAHGYIMIASQLPALPGWAGTHLNGHSHWMFCSLHLAMSIYGSNRAIYRAIQGVNCCGYIGKVWFVAREPATWPYRAAPPGAAQREREIAQAFTDSGY